MLPSDTSDECHAQTIVRNAIGGVALCPGCGHIHLNLQYLTLRFESEAFAELAALVTTAQRLLDDDAASAGRHGGEAAEPAEAGAGADALH